MGETTKSDYNLYQFSCSECEGRYQAAQIRTWCPKCKHINDGDLPTKVMYFDTETTGLSLEQNEIIQVAIIVEIDGGVVAEKSWRLRPLNKNFHPKAQEVTGITPAQAAKFPHPSGVVKEITKFSNSFVDVKNRKDVMAPIGYNVVFDIDRLVELYEKQRSHSYWDFMGLGQRICVLSDFNKYCLRAGVKTKNRKLGTACEHFGINLEAHDALNDIRATRELYLRLIDFFEGE